MLFQFPPAVSSPACLEASAPYKTSERINHIFATISSDSDTDTDVDCRLGYPPTTSVI